MPYLSFILPCPFIQLLSLLLQSLSTVQAWVYPPTVYIEDRTWALNWLPPTKKLHSYWFQINCDKLLKKHYGIRLRIIIDSGRIRLGIGKRLRYKVVWQVVWWEDWLQSIAGAVLIERAHVGPWQRSGTLAPLTRHWPPGFELPCLSSHSRTF